MKFSKPSELIILLVVAFALFMDSLDTSIINTAIPSMSQYFNVPPVNLKIALISYLISLAIFIPISGWLADKYGVKKIFLLALSIFTISSFICGYSHTLTQLVIARSLQGFGGALMLPLGRLIILKTYPRHEIVDAMNKVIMVVSVGLMLGPLAGGIITYHFSWPWIFWINIPVGIAAFVFGYYYLEEFPLQPVHTFDFIGFILFASGISGITFALAYISESFEHAHATLQIVLASAITLIFYAYYAYKKKHVIIKISLFRFRTFQVSVLGNLFSRIGFGGVPFVLPLLLQVGLKYNPQVAGLLLIPIAIGILFIKSISLHILRWLGYKNLLIINTFFVCISLISFSQVNEQTSFIVIALMTFMFGFLIALQYSGLNSLSYSDISAEDMSSATSIVSTCQQLSQSFGVAASALFIQYFSQQSLTHTLTPAIFHQTFIAMAIITFFSMVIFFRLKKFDGHQLLSPVKISDSSL